MKYVMSDLHGNYDKYMEMINLIDLKEEDQLYVLGDIFDRGDNPIGILEHIRRNKNIFLIKGNHEQMFVECYEDEFRDMYGWMCNGGMKTYEQLISRGQLFMEHTYRYLKKLPYLIVIDKFILVHAGLYLPSNLNDLELCQLINEQDEENCIWTRSNIGRERKFKDYTIVAGHNVIQGIIQENDPSILHREGHIYIDSGLQTAKTSGKLSCLRLDDMKEFYI